MHSLWTYSQQTDNPPFHHTSNVPASEFLDIASPDFLIEGPSLHHRLEEPLDPVESEEDRVVGNGPPKQKTKRKRGPPKLPRRSRSSKSTITRRKRIPHHEVERKYRNTLNIAMEQLRARVPTLPQHDGSFTAPPKPSKAFVLAAAVEYIGLLEGENAKLVKEVENIKRVYGTGDRPLNIGRREVSRRKPKQ